MVHSSLKKAATLGIAVIALAASLAPLPNLEAQKSGGIGGVAGGVLANYIYDALTGNRVPVTLPMDGKITAKPKVEAFGGSRKTQTINGYAHDGLRPDLGGDFDRGYNDDKWTEYFNVDYGEVIDNPDYDPEAEPGEANSRKYILPVSGEFNDHGDEFKSRSAMEKEYSTARKGWRYDDDGRKWPEFTKNGRWVYVGESERIKCDHRLLNEVDVVDNRLAKNQTYRAEVWWKLDHLTWSKEEEDFVWRWTDEHWNVGRYTLSATSSSRKKIQILEKNTEINELEEKGSSQLYWVGVDIPAKIFHHRGYTVWERAHYDELKEKEGR